MSQFYDQASLVMVPSGYKAGKVYSQKPLSTDGELTFTRNSNATRVNADGLVEKVRTNLLLQSNQFDTTWQTVRATLNGGQAGYDGNNAWSITSDSSLNSHYVRQYGFTYSGVQTISVYAKANGVNFLMIGTQSADIQGYFDLSTGSVGSTGIYTIDANMTDVGNGWYKCDYTFNGTITYIYLFAALQDGNNVWQGDGTSGIYIQDAQLETGDIATQYIETTTAAVSVGPTANVPRLDYSGGCPALKLEPQRSNLALWSEAFDNAGWNKSGSGGTITANYGISPDGYQNAERYTATSGSRYVVYQNVPVSSGSTYTVSMYAKSLGGSQKIRIGADSGCANPQGAQTFTVGEEWTRISVTITSNQAFWNVYVDNVESGIACTGTYLTADFLIYGFQCELGSYETSLIPTLGASVTRLADAAYKTGISSLIGQTEGTLFVEMNINKRVDLGGSGPNGLEIKDASGSNVIMIGTVYGLSQAFRLAVRNAGSFSSLVTTTNNALGTYKLAAAYSSAGFVFYVNGVQIGTSATLPPSATFADMGLMQVFGTNNPQSELVNQALLFKTRLTNAQLAELTTL